MKHQRSSVEDSQVNEEYLQKMIKNKKQLTDELQGVREQVHNLELKIGSVENIQRLKHS
jgi:hypothetical protein